jgi:hypothetical protein
MRENSKPILLVVRMIAFGLILLLVFSGIIYHSPGPISGPSILPASESAAETPEDYFESSVYSLGTREARTGNDNINVTPIGTFSPAYLGDQGKEFYFWVTESYNGEYLDFTQPFSTPEGDHNASLWNVTLKLMEFYFDGQPISPVSWDPQHKTQDNNGAFGWLVNSGLGFYNDSSTNTMFRFDIDPFGVKTGIYMLELIFEYRILVNYSDSTGQYNFTNFQGSEIITEVETLVFEVMSCMSSNLKVEAVSENNFIINNGRFYAGAYNQKLQIMFNKQYPGAALEDVNVTLIPPEIVEIYGSMGMDPQYKVSMKSLSVNTPFFWRVNVNNSAVPGIYYGSAGLGYLYYEYTRSDNQVRILEGDRYPVDFIIDYTPLLIPPSTNGMTATVPDEHRIEQGTSNTKLTVGFINEGNVDLHDINLGLDLSNSHIMPPYYYNAGTGDTKTELILWYDTISWLPKGGSAHAGFNISLFKGLAKGKYFIPVVYSAWYYNNGTLGDPSGFIPTDHNEFNQIRSTRALSVLDTIAHVGVQILDDEPAIMVNPIASSVFNAGAHNQVLGLTVTNYELYAFQNVTISILTNSESPFEHKSQANSADHLTKKTYTTLSAGTTGAPYYTTFSVLTDVKSDANGFYSVPVEITGWDEFNDYFKFTTTFEVSIIPQLPEFIVVNSMNSAIIPGENFTLTVTLKNVGGSVANNLSVLFIGSSDYTNTFITDGDGIVPIERLAAGEQVTLVINVTSDANLSIDANYQVSLKFRFVDDLGNVYGFNDNTPAIFFIRTSRKEFQSAMETFIVTGVVSPDISPGKTITLTVKVMNIGDFEISEANLKLVSNSNLFTVEPNSGAQMVTVGPLMPTDEKGAKFKVTVAESVEAGEVYEFQLFIQYKDSTNQTKAFDTSDWLPVSIRIKDSAPSEKEDRANWELVTLGILILIAVIIFAFLIDRMFTRHRFVRKLKKKRMRLILK